MTEIQTNLLTALSYIAHAWHKGDSKQADLLALAGGALVSLYSEPEWRVYALRALGGSVELWKEFTGPNGFPR